MLNRFQSLWEQLSFGQKKEGERKIVDQDYLRLLLLAFLTSTSPRLNLSLDFLFSSSSLSLSVFPSF